LRDEQSETWHKIVWNDFEQALLDPKGEGQEARSNLYKSDADHEIATVILFLRNDSALFLLICAQYPKDQQTLILTLPTISFK